VPLEAGSFDRILVHGRLDVVPQRLLDVLEEDGRIVMARPDRNVAWRQTLIEVRPAADGTIAESELCTCRLPALLPGLARVL
jgi:protein-L-isoaspartate(D-aspartate) O-methyltransferase